MDNFQKLSAKYGVNDPDYDYNGGAHVLADSDYCPCYVRKGDIPSSGFAIEDMAPYIRACARQTIGVVVLSVTERDTQHKEWLAEAAKIKGVNITRGRSTNHGGYPVWLITIPGTKK